MTTNRPGELRIALGDQAPSRDPGREDQRTGDRTARARHGRGLSGLTAARNLSEAGCSVSVLEARSRVGGRVENGTLSDGQWIELGGQWIGTGQAALRALIDHLALDLIPTYNVGRTTVRLGGRTSYMPPQLGAMPRLKPFALVDLTRALTRFGELVRSVDIDEPWHSPGAAELDAQTLESWIRRSLLTAGARGYFRSVAETALSADTTELSLLHAAFLARSSDGLDTLIAVDGGAHQSRVLGGASLIAERLAIGLDIRLSTPVRAIRQSSDRVVVTTRFGEEFDADRIVVAIPPALAGGLDYHPVLPGWRDQLASRLVAGATVKQFLVYPTPFWRDDDLSGRALGDSTAVHATFDATPVGYGRGVLAGMSTGESPAGVPRPPALTLGGRHSRTASWTSSDREGATPSSTSSGTGLMEEFSRGAYGALFAPGAWTAYGHALAEPVGRIHWAGTETSPIGNGHLEGAVRSGSRAAEELLRALVSSYRSGWRFLRNGACTLGRRRWRSEQWHVIGRLADRCPTIP